jgi:ribonucleoside-triphosphate reductase
MQETKAWLKVLVGNDPSVLLSGKCHDCGLEVRVGVERTKDGISVDGPVWKIGDIDKPFFKCDPCFDKDATLRNYQPTEVYSRVCGYLRPVRQWNKGKQAEFDQRTDYKV